MKTRFSVDIHAEGSLNKELFKALTSHNSGTQPFGFADLLGFLAVVKAVYPSLHENITWECPNAHTVVIKEREIACLTITENIVVDLELSAEDKDNFQNTY
jgi:hypothetical protein